MSREVNLKPSKSNHPNYPIVIAAGLVILAVDLVGWCAGVNHLEYDTALRVLGNDEPTNVVLVYANRSDLHSQVSRMVRMLHAQRVRCIGVTVPVEIDQTTRRELQRYPNVVFASTKNDENRNGLVYGEVGLLNTQKVYREHYAYALDEATKQPSLETALARQVLLPTDAIPQAKFRINYRGGANSLPHFDQSELFAGELIPEIVADKAVLIGLRPDTETPRIATPVDSGASMSVLELHGHILNTLLIKKPIYSIGSPTRSSIFAILIVVSICVYQRLAPRWMIPICMGMVGCMVVCSWVLLSYCQLWLSISSLVFANVACCLFVLNHRLQFLNSATSRFTLHRKLQTHGTNVELWKAISDLTHQMFLPNRLVLFELPLSATHLKIVNAVNCEEEAVLDRRRDFRRPPFSIAASQAKPYLCNEPRFFDSKSEEDLQFLVPLIFAGDILGFVALEFERKIVNAKPEIIPQLQRLAEIVAASVAGHRAIQQQQRRGMLQTLTSVPECDAVDNLLLTEEESQRRLNQLNRIFERSNTGLAMYDVFGQQTLMNTAMRCELQLRGLVASDTSVSELISTFTAKDQNFSRDVLRDVFMGAKSRQLSVRNKIGHAAMLHIHPYFRVSRDESLDLTDQTEGFIFEIESSASFASELKLKNKITTQLCDEFARHIDQLQTSVRSLDETDESVKIHRSVSRMKDDLLELKGVLQKGRSYLGQSFIDDADQCLPVHIADSLSGLLDSANRFGMAPGIPVECRFDGELPDVVANPILLEQTFQAILELLADSAYEQTTLQVVAENHVVEVELKFTSQGTGASTAQLRESLQSGVLENKTKRLRAVETWLEHWGAHMKIDIASNDEPTVQLVLQVHHWASLLSLDSGRSPVVDRTGAISKTATDESTGKV